MRSGLQGLLFEGRYGVACIHRRCVSRGVRAVRFSSGCGQGGWCGRDQGLGSGGEGLGCGRRSGWGGQGQAVGPVGGVGGRLGRSNIVPLRSLVSGGRCYGSGSFLVAEVGFSPVCRDFG